ncbi:MAG: glycoside hydrolase family 3 N-terminal domain-containing protein [Solirubrobacteraceae bacterium]
MLAAPLLVGCGAANKRSGSASPLPSAPLPRMVGQQLMVAMGGSMPDSDLLRRIRAGQAGGVSLSGENIASPEHLRAVVSRLQAAARAGGNPPLLIATDQEGGRVKRLPWAPPALTPLQMSAAGAAVSREQGRRTGTVLASVGINVDLAPVLDVAHSPAAFIWREGRSFGMSPAAVIDSALPFALGLQAAGVAATAKHYPGVGGAVANTDYTHDTIPVTAQDLLPYRAAIASKLALIMLSTAAYPNLDPSGARAVQSRAIVSGLLRGRSSYRGVVITDDVEVGTTRTGPAVVAAAAAGADIVLVSSSEPGGATAFRALLAGARDGRVPIAGVVASYGRVLALKRAYASR